MSCMLKLMCTVKMVNNKVGVDLSPSMSIKDHTVVGASDKIERMPLT